MTPPPPSRDSAPAVSVTEVRHVRGRRLDGQVDGRHLERETHEEYDEEQKKEHEVFHHFTDDDRPGSEQVVERQEVHELYKTEEHAERVELVTSVHEQETSVGIKEYRQNVNEYSDSTDANHSDLQKHQSLSDRRAHWRHTPAATGTGTV